MTSSGRMRYRDGHRSCEEIALASTEGIFPSFSRRGKGWLVKSRVAAPYRCREASALRKCAARASARWLRTFTNHPYPSLKRRGLARLTVAPPLKLPDFGFQPP